MIMNKTIKNYFINCVNKLNYSPDDNFISAIPVFWLEYTFENLDAISILLRIKSKERFKYFINLFDDDGYCINSNSLFINYPQLRLYTNYKDSDLKNIIITKLWYADDKGNIYPNIDKYGDCCYGI